MSWNGTSFHLKLLNSNDSYSSADLHSSYPKMQLLFLFPFSGKICPGWPWCGWLGWVKILAHAGLQIIGHVGLQILDHEGGKEKGNFENAFLGCQVLKSARISSIWPSRSRALLGKCCKGYCGVIHVSVHECVRSRTWQKYIVLSVSISLFS